MLPIMRLFTLGSVLVLSACSHYQFSSNLDKENFEEYFKPSQVSIYEKEDLSKLDYQVLGAVSGSSCQEERNDRAANMKEARTNARINATHLNANGIVFQSCIEFEKDNTCITNIICYGRAIEVFVDE